MQPTGFKHLVHTKCINASYDCQLTEETKRLNDLMSIKFIFLLTNAILKIVLL